MGETPPSEDASMTLIGATALPMQLVQGAASGETGTEAGCNGTDQMRASDLDLRKTKGELFSKLTERPPQQMIVTPALNRTSSDENIVLNSSYSASKGLNRLEFSCHGSSTSFSGATQLGRQQQQPSPFQQELTDSYSAKQAHKQQKLAASDQPEPVDPALGVKKQETSLFAKVRARWYTNEEVAGILTSYGDHPEWQSNELQIRPKSGAVLLYSREKVRYRQDGYCWKKRKNGRTTREDHMKLKVQGVECIYGCYVHSALLPTFHRRCYWLLENPDIVLVHYLNQPPDDKNKMILTFSPGLLESDTKRRWTNEEIIEEIGSVFGGISHIHRTLSINFPTANAALPLGPGAACDLRADAMAAPAGLEGQTRPKSATSAAAGLAVGDMATTDANNNAHTLDSRLAGIGMVIINSRIGSQVGAMRDDNPMQTIDADDCEDDESGQSDDLMAAAIQDDSAEALGGGEPSACGGFNDEGQESEDAAMSFDAMVDQQRPAGDGAVLANINSSCVADRQPDESDPVMVMYGAKAADAQAYRLGKQPDHQQLAELDSKNFCDQEKLVVGADGSMQMLAAAGDDTNAGPYSPVTQIYNKIVDDIDTYAIPLELNQYNHSHHHHLHHHQHHQQRHLHLDSCDIQSMDTSEPDQQASPKRAADGESYQMISQEPPSPCDGRQFSADCAEDKTDCDPVQLIACDLFVNCNDPGEDQPGACPGDTVDELLSCHDPSDPLDLFSFKPLNCDSLKHPHLLLDVKSTTSETETLDRLSPINSGRQPPRCNSSDDAMQLSAARVDQYLHHASVNFLANAAPEEDQQSLENLAEFGERRPQHSDSGVAVTGHHRSSASTEQSNSTSTSSLLNAAGGLGGGCSRLSGASYMSGQSADQGLPSSLGSNYNDSSTASSSFIKLPLPQRQNSEQKEPSNSILSSLLPKALSLDGSDLASTTNYGHAHAYHSHHQRASPLVGAYHHGPAGLRVGSSSHHNSRASAYGHQPGAGNLLLVPSTGGSPQRALQQTHRHHQYQRPSAPTISPSSYSFDPSVGGPTGAGKVPHNGGGGGLPYRSGSVATGSVCYHQSAGGQQPQQSSTDYARLADSALASRAGLLPIVDYVPNWSPSSGGTKILLIGRWSNLTGGDGPAEPPATSAVDEPAHAAGKQQPNCDRPRESAFFVLFDELAVPATLIQSNVLRCYSPCHKPGFIALKVVHKNLIASEQVLFEIRPAGGALATGPQQLTAATAAATAAAESAPGQPPQSQPPTQPQPQPPPQQQLRSSLGFEQAEASKTD